MSLRTIHEIENFCKSLTGMKEGDMLTLLRNYNFNYGNVSIGYPILFSKSYIAYKCDSTGIVMLALFVVSTGAFTTYNDSDVFDWYSSYDLNSANSYIKSINDKFNSVQVRH
jgi:hypothetical protein